MKNTRYKTRNINILFTCTGRRVSLLNSFAAAAKSLKINLSIVGTDTTPLSPALQSCDKKYLVRPIKHANYIKQLFTIVKNSKIDLLIPTVDLDLKILAQKKQEFQELGCRVLVSSSDVIDICQNKRKTYSFLRKNGFDTPGTISARTALSKKKLDFPCFIKPLDGYASRGNAVVKNRKELVFYAQKVPNAICQEFICGSEYTCDVYVDFDMKVRCVVPRKRLEIRGGEVSKAQTVKNTEIMAQAKALVAKLGAGPGVITLQLFLTDDGRIRFIEVNPRFGGGVPLSIKAGANFPKWILRELLGLKQNICFDDFEDDMIMLRYDGEVWLKKTSDRDLIDDIR